MPQNLLLNLLFLMYKLRNKILSHFQTNKKTEIKRLVICTNIFQNGTIS